MMSEMLGLKKVSASFLSMGRSKEQGQMQRIRVSIVVKRVNNCPQIGRNFHVKLKWGKSRLLGMHEEQTSAVICKDRAVVWDQKFEREVQVYLEGSAPEPNDIAERERLIKKQPSSAFLRMSLRQDSERSFGSHTRYGFVEQNLVEWAWDIGDGDTHRQGMLVYGTNNASHLEVEVAISWVGQTQPILQTIDTPRASFESANTPHSHSNGDKKSLRFSAATTKGAHRPDKIMIPKPGGPPLEPRDDSAGVAANTTAGGKGLNMDRSREAAWISSAPEADVKLDVEHVQFLSAGASRAVAAFDKACKMGACWLSSTPRQVEDRVKIAIQASKMPAKECDELIEDIFRRFRVFAEQTQDNTAAGEEEFEHDDESASTITY